MWLAALFAISLHAEDKPTPATRISRGVYGCEKFAGHPDQGDGEALGLLIETLCDMSKPFKYDSRRSMLCCTGR